MLTKTKNNRWLFGSKIALALLSVACTAALLSFDSKPGALSSAGTEGKIVVVIDLGHGGNDEGATSPDGKVKEVEIIDAIGSLIKGMDTESRFVFTREGENIPLRDRAARAGAEQARLLLSLHIGASENRLASGVEIFYASSTAVTAESKRIGETIANQLVFRAGNVPNAVKPANFVVLRESSCPSVMLSLGFISNPSDLDYLTNKRNQADLAKQIVAIISRLSL